MMSLTRTILLIFFSLSLLGCKEVDRPLVSRSTIKQALQSAYPKQTTPPKKKVKEICDTKDEDVKWRKSHNYIKDPQRRFFYERSKKAVLLAKAEQQKQRAQSGLSAKKNTQKTTQAKNTYSALLQQYYSACKQLQETDPKKRRRLCAAPKRQYLS